MPIKILVNGKEEKLENEMNISELLKKKNIRPEVVTVELNEKIIERKDYQLIRLKEKDVLELVFFMGGGSTHFVRSPFKSNHPERENEVNESKEANNA